MPFPPSVAAGSSDWEERKLMESIWIVNCILLTFFLAFKLGFHLGKKKGLQEKIEIEIGFIKKEGSNTILDGIKNRHDSDLFTTGREN